MAFTLIILGALADILTTRHILRNGGREANPGPASIMAKHGFTTWAAIRIAVSIGVYAITPEPLQWLAVAISWGFPIWNLVQIRRKM